MMAFAVSTMNAQSAVPAPQSQEPVKKECCKDHKDGKKCDKPADQQCDDCKAKAETPKHECKKGEGHECDKAGAPKHECKKGEGPKHECKEGEHKCDKAGAPQHECKKGEGPKHECKEGEHKCDKTGAPQHECKKGEGPKHECKKGEGHKCDKPADQQCPDCKEKAKNK